MYTPSLFEFSALKAFHIALFYMAPSEVTTLMNSLDASHKIVAFKTNFACIELQHSHVTRNSQEPALIGTSILEYSLLGDLFDFLGYIVSS
jgi:hypothetical protein